MELNNPNVKIQYKINRKTDLGDFNDAMYFTAEEWESMTPKRLSDLENVRILNWRSNVITSSTTEPTEEELLAAKIEIQKQLDLVDTQLSEKQSRTIEVGKLNG